MLLQLLACLPDSIVLSPVLVAVLEDQSDVALEFCGGGVLGAVHLGLDGLEVHGLLDDGKVVGDVVADRVNGGFERADEAGPVIC